MLVFQHILLAINVLLVLVFGIDYSVIDSDRMEPRAKAKLGAWLCILFFVFLALLLLFAVLSAALRRNALYLALSVYVMIPFAIGRLASYRTVRFYSALQLLAFLLSAVTLYFI